MDEATIASLVDGVVEAATRPALMRHLASCAHCRAAVAAVSRIVDDTAVARAVAVAERRRWRWRVPAALAAAAAVVTLLLWPRPPNDGPITPATHRAPTITATGQPVPLEPIGTVDDAATLRWARVAGADGYRVTLFDANGRVLYERQLSDTSATLPDSVTFAPGQTYLWKVEARTDWNRWTASPLVRFSLGRSLPQ